MSAKPMTAAQYRANADKVKSQQPTEIVTLKSGAVFELRKADLQGYVVTGRVPHSLLVEGLKAWGKKGSGLAVTDEDTVNALITMREVVQDCCVNPRFVEYVKHDAHCKGCDWKGQTGEMSVEVRPADEGAEPIFHCPKCNASEFIWELGASDMLPADFSEIFAWAMGVTGLDDLLNFRAGQERGVSGAVPDVPELRTDAVTETAN